jgi:hypothetical protein
MMSIIFPPATSDIGTMPPCESTLGYIDLASSDLDKEHSSWHDVGGGVIILMRIDSEEEHPPKEEVMVVISEELDGMQEEDLEEHMVVEEYIHQCGMRKKWCIARWRSPLSLSARTDFLHG